MARVQGNQLLTVAESLAQIALGVCYQDEVLQSIKMAFVPAPAGCLPKTPARFSQLFLEAIVLEGMDEIFAEAEDLFMSAGAFFASPGRLEVPGSVDKRG